MLISLIVSMIAMQKGKAWVPRILAVAAGTVMVWAIVKGQQATGFDGIGYGIIALLMAAPVILGALVGAIIGWVRNRKARRARPEP